MSFHKYVMHAYQIWIMNMNPLLKIPFFILYKTDLIFINQIPFFYPLQNKFDFLIIKFHFSQPYKTDLIFLWE